MRTKPILLIAILCASTSAEPERLRLTADTESPIIILPPDGESLGETRLGAIQLSIYLSRIIGRDVRVLIEGRGLYSSRKGRNWRVIPFARLKEKPSGRPEIHVGWTSRSAKEVKPAEIEKLDIDGFRIKTTANAVFLVGARDWSTAYACTTFLEEFCGVRWFLPGDFGEDVPLAPNLSVLMIDKTYEPAYLHRQYSGFKWRNHHELVAWGKRNKIRPRLSYHHNLHRVFDVTRYGKQYPEIYPILGGRRRVPGPGTVAGWQPCLTHPKAVDIAVEYAAEQFGKNPDLTSISLGVNDGGRYCECERCMKIVDKDATEDGERQGRRSVWFFNFANAVAKKFDERFPDKLIGYLLYGECKKFPAGMKIHPRLIGFYVVPSFTLITKEGTERFNEGLEELTKSVSRFALYDWFYGDGICVPRLQIRQAKYYLEHGYDMGARHLKAEAYMNWGLDGFKYWMHSRLMWNPRLKVDAMMDEFLTGFFKESAAPMRQYFKIVEHYTVKPAMGRHELRPDDDPEIVNFRFRYPTQLLSFPPKAAEECLPHLEKAEKLARSFLVQERVRYFRKAFDVARMMTLRYHHAILAQPMLQTAETLPQGMELLAKAMHKDLDVDQYYKWALRGDPYCVRHPERSMFGATTKARGFAARTLGDQVISQLKRLNVRPIPQNSLDAVVRRVVEKALAGIKDPDAREIALTSVAPYAGKVILCNRQPTPKVDGKLDDACWRNTRPI
ncbi:MAG: DUF4838 domain-containing protein, partial [Planctomycetota bacterium]|nr:DUF4838 domain-containing protein [Planctomycetota bacterium]